MNNWHESVLFADDQQRSNAMSIREDVKKRAGGKCECKMKGCSHHNGRCNAILRGEWEVHRVTAGGPYNLSNVIALCQRCHRKTPSYGRGRK
ncbi:MAG: HNH endonuclease [Thermoleophilia bacterium]